jgi:hypothetical protein
VSYMGRPTTMPFPPPLKQINREESSELLGIDEFVHRLPLLGELEETEESRRQGGVPEQDVVAFAPRLKMKRTRGLTFLPRSVSPGLDW